LALRLLLGMSTCWLLLLWGRWRSGRNVLAAALVRLCSDRCRGLLTLALAAVRLRDLPKTLPAPCRTVQQVCCAVRLRHILGLLHLRAVGGLQRSVVVGLPRIPRIDWSCLLASCVRLHLVSEL
jgi:hypothetical protein